MPVHVRLRVGEDRHTDGGILGLLKLDDIEGIVGVGQLVLTSIFERIVTVAVLLRQLHPITL